MSHEEEESGLLENAIKAVKEIRKIKEANTGSIIHSINRNIFAYRALLKDGRAEQHSDGWDIRVDIKDIVDSVGIDYYEDNYQKGVTDYIESLGVSDWEHDGDGILIVF